MTTYRVLRASDDVIAAPGQTVTYDPVSNTWVPTDDAGGGGGGGAVDSVNGQTGTVVLDASDVGAAPTSHSHAAADVTSGTLDVARIPTGTTSSTVALGNHTHTPADIGAATAAQGALAVTAVQPGDDAGTLGSGAATAGQVLTADGAGATSWQEAGGGGGSLVSGGLAPYAFARLTVNAASVPLVPVGARAMNSARPVDGSPVRMNLMPVSIGADLPVLGFAVKIATADSGEQARFGIYGTAADGGPGDLLWDSGAVDASATGVVAIAASLTLPAGTLWVCGSVSSTGVLYYGWDAGALGSPDAWPPNMSLPRGYVLRTDHSGNIVTGGYPASLSTANFQRGHDTNDGAPVIYAKVA